jgi:hypothetical protein
MINQILFFLYLIASGLIINSFTIRNIFKIYFFKTLHLIKNIHNLWTIFFLNFTLKILYYTWVNSVIFLPPDSFMAPPWWVYKIQIKCKLVRCKNILWRPRLFLGEIIVNCRVVKMLHLSRIFWKWVLRERREHVLGFESFDR